MALPRAHRIRRTGEFAAVRAKGTSVPGRLLILAVMPLPDEPHPRFGFTVTRKVGNAVCRNRLRRRFSTIIDRVRGQIAAAHLIVTIPRYGAAKAEFADLEAEWVRLARRARLLPPAP